MQLCKVIDRPVKRVHLYRTCTYSTGHCLLKNDIKPSICKWLWICRTTSIQPSRPGAGTLKNINFLDFKTKRKGNFWYVNAETHCMCVKSQSHKQSFEDLRSHNDTNILHEKPLPLVNYLRADKYARSGRCKIYVSFVIKKTRSRCKGTQIELKSELNATMYAEARKRKCWGQWSVLQTGKQSSRNQYVLVEQWPQFWLHLLSLIDILTAPTLRLG